MNGLGFYKFHTLPVKNKKLKKKIKKKYNNNKNETKNICMYINV